MSLIIFIITSILIIISVIKFPKFKKLDTYYIIAFIGALLMILTRQISLKEVYHSLILNPMISPIKILILFISMSFLSITLDTLGFFDYIATITAKKAKGSQYKLFTLLYIVISILTIFTSNDVVILTFTPFICYFSKKAKINPIPYLIEEFVAANTLSMMLEIGNPTNILLSLSYNISFLEYLKVMFIPTLIVSIILFFILFLLFKNELKVKMEVTESSNRELNKVLVTISLIHIILATILLSISNYINIEMYLVCLVLSISLFLIIFIYNLITKKNKKTLSIVFIRLPYGIIPFLISMFILVESLNLNGFTEQLALFLNKFNNIYSYGLSSFLLCNVMNNIPMSVLYANALQYTNNNAAIYAVIIGSNLGAYLTPIGALAGIMWMNIIKAFDIKFSFLKFIKYGILLSGSAILIALTVLMLIY